MNNTRILYKNQNTIISDVDDMQIITLHSTDIVRFTDTQIILSSGRWMTNTTKKIMNRVSNDFNLGFNVYQMKNRWFVSFNGIEYPFSDGMTLDR